MYKGITKQYYYILYYSLAHILVNKIIYQSTIFHKLLKKLIFNHMHILADGPYFLAIVITIIIQIINYVYHINFHFSIFFYWQPLCFLLRWVRKAMLEEYEDLHPSFGHSKHFSKFDRLLE